MRIVIRAIVAAGMLGAGSMASAQTEDFSGYHQIVQGDYPAAEQVIDKQLRLFPHDPDLVLNLAIVYVRTGRAQQARTLYRDVLARPDADIVLANDRNGSSHALARAGLAQLEQVKITAR